MLYVSGERLLYIYVLAGAQCLARQGEVGVAWGSDDHGLNIRMFKDRIEAAARLNALVLAPYVLELLFVGIANDCEGALLSEVSDQVLTPSFRNL